MNSHAATPDLILASTSAYRRDLLSRLVTAFRAVAPDVDESAQAGEAPGELARRLAAAKAHAVAATCPGALVIGSDQVAEIDGEAIGKPGTVAAANAQLARASGRAVQFHTAVCLVDTRQQPWRVDAGIDTTRVVFRDLAADEIARYVDSERPLDCAGSFKSEARGIALMQRIDNTDPSALIGLPLILLCGMLRRAGIQIP